MKPISENSAEAREKFMPRYYAERLDGLKVLSLLMAAAMGSLMTWLAIMAWGCP